MNSDKKDYSVGFTPSADKLNVFDPNMDIPSEPPPSYDESMEYPSVPLDQTNQYQRPSAPPPNSNPNVLQVPVSGQTTSSSTSSASSFSHSTNGSQFQRPTVPPQSSRPLPTSQYQSPRPSPSAVQLPKPTPINPNPYLPWKYPSSYRCSKCDNTGFRKNKNKPCKRCWQKFRPGVIPPETQRQLENLVNHPPAPRPVNSNVLKLPPGQVMSYPVYPQGNGPVVVKPGDPRIGGILCPRCNGRGMVHFFLDLERCQTCNGLGRVSFNGRPL